MPPIRSLYVTPPPTQPTMGPVTTLQRLRDLYTDTLKDFIPADLLKALLPSQDVTMPLTTVLPAGAAAQFTDQELAGPVKRTIKAFHGSPHDFGEVGQRGAFLAEKIGTGEGAQAFSYGHYFGEHPGTAESYRSGLAGYPEIDSLKLGNKTIGQHNNFDYNPRGNSNYENVQSSLFEDLLLDQNSLVGQPPDKIQSHVLSTLDQKIADYVKEWPEGVADAKRLRADLSRPGAVRLKMGERPGKSYEVNLHTADEYLLDWDKPLSQQSQRIQDALKKAGIADPEKQGHLTGENIVHRAGAMSGMIGTDANIAASRMLEEAGLHGVQYKDQVSRGVTNKGTRNIVMFPGTEHLIEIANKYGISLPVAASLYKWQQSQGKQKGVE